MIEQVVFYGFVVGFALLLIGAWGGHKLVQRGKEWPEVEAVVVDRELIATDPADYRVTVEYSYLDGLHRSMPRNPYGLNEARMRVGDKVVVKVDPRAPGSCFLVRDLTPILY